MATNFVVMDRVHVMMQLSRLVSWCLALGSLVDPCFDSRKHVIPDVFWHVPVVFDIELRVLGRLSSCRVSTRHVQRVLYRHGQAENHTAIKYSCNRMGKPQEVRTNYV